MMTLLEWSHPILKSYGPVLFEWVGSEGRRFELLRACDLSSSDLSSDLSRCDLYCRSELGVQSESSENPDQLPANSSQASLTTWVVLRREILCFLHSACALSSHSSLVKGEAVGSTRTSSPSDVGLK